MLQTPEGFSPLTTRSSSTALAAPALRFVFRADELLVADDLQLPSHTLADALATEHLAQSADSAIWHAVGEYQGRLCQTAWLPLQTQAPPGHSFRKMRPLFGQMDDPLLALACRAFQVSHWARTHRYCGACGAATRLLAGERCMRCTGCGHMAYPRISPAMMVLIQRGDHILLARHTHSPAPFYTALAGFVEAGESVEETVHREVMEEVGLKVKNLRYFASQPWAFPHSLMIAFTAEYAGGDIRIDPTEIADARWFGPGDTLPLTPSTLSIASALIRANVPPGAIVATA
jgi:NAD+ diphosphatase